MFPHAKPTGPVCWWQSTIAIAIAIAIAIGEAAICRPVAKQEVGASAGFIESGMDIDDIKGRLAFLQEAEKLKSVLRSAHTSTGRAESTAEHSWRLCLMAMTFADGLVGMDMLKVFKMCLVHDLGEAIHGDIPAIEKNQHPDKSAQEKADLLHLTRSLDEAHRNAILALWQEYEDAASPEAKAVKALDKLETILQHNQGLNPPDFDYAFNLTYGQQHTSADPLFAVVRSLLDEGTRRRMAESSHSPNRQSPSP